MTYIMLNFYLFSVIRKRNKKFQSNKESGALSIFDLPRGDSPNLLTGVISSACRASHTECHGCAMYD